MSNARKVVRCAIYTRKSTEDGLEQEYNSLDAQYDACAAYALSQQHEGWTLVKDRYDDGGFSGGTMDRPALKRLLADIEENKVDIILLYKIDRLTRSLSDFAKIVEILDKQEASFVSITQSFNTTTSMGRLTLNMLLSFAQFEREVTGERIRDKIAASKRKGLWMGGPLPLGYDVIDRKLVVNEAEAELVRHIMQRYVELNSVRELVDELKREGYRTKVQVRTSTGNRGGCSFERGTLYHLLSNRIYRGMIVHKSEAFAGEHEAIVPEELWDKVQVKLAERSQGGNSRAISSKVSLLTGLLYDGEGRAMVCSHTQKGNRRFRYYNTRPELVDQNTAWRVKAQDIEAIVVDQIVRTLHRPTELESLLQSDSYNAEQLRAVIAGCATIAKNLPVSSDSQKHDSVQRIIHRIELHEGKVVLTFNNTGTMTTLPIDQIPATSSTNLVIECAATKVRRGQELRLVILPASDRDSPVMRDERLVNLLADARCTLALVKANPHKSIPVLAAEHKRCRIRMGKLLRVACLAPDIVVAIVEGRQPMGLTARKLLEAELPLSWDDQKRVLGFV
jgi:DNA invertase Pin-like site-specific DNA recombinase